MINTVIEIFKILRTIVFKISNRLYVMLATSRFTSFSFDDANFFLKLWTTLSTGSCTRNNRSIIPFSKKKKYAHKRKTYTFSSNWNLKEQIFYKYICVYFFVLKIILRDFFGDRHEYHLFLFPQ